MTNRQDNRRHYFNKSTNPYAICMLLMFTYVMFGPIGGFHGATAFGICFYLVIDDEEATARTTAKEPT